MSKISVQDCDLETLQHILSQFSDNLKRDCPDIIIKILKPLSEPCSNESAISQCKKVFASINVLLSLYEKLNGSDILSELLVSCILKSMKNILCCNGGNCFPPDKDTQLNILSIISRIFKNLNLENAFYIYILTNLEKTECKIDCITFKLNIIKTIYNAVVVQNGKFDAVNVFDNCELFADLVFNGSDNVAMHTLMYLIPEHVKCFKSDTAVRVSWRYISDNLTESKYLRALTALCNFFDISNINLLELLMEDGNYWKLVQFALVGKDPLQRKQGMFLLKKTIDLLNSSNRNFHTELFCWDCKSDLGEVYSDVITCLEFLEEQQVHIIEPVLGKMEALSAKALETDRVHPSWILLLYKKALSHDSGQIVRWGVSSLLKLRKLFTKLSKDTAKLLVDSLTNTSLYYSGDFQLVRDLGSFFDELKSESFFIAYVTEICHRVWSAEALFFVMHSLSTVKRFPCWKTQQISLLGEFVSKAFKTHDRIIRTRTQQELLTVIMNLTDTEHVPLENVVLLLSKFSPMKLENMDAAHTFLSESYSGEEFQKVLDRYKSQQLSPEFNEKFLSLLLVSRHFETHSDYLQTMLLSFRDIHKRPYCDSILYDRYLCTLCCIFENICDRNIVERTVPFLKDIISYIQTQLQKTSKLADFNDLYITAFEVLSKVFISCSEVFNDFYVHLLKDTEDCLSSDGCESIGIFWRIKLLSLAPFCEFSLMESSLKSYILYKVNEPLMKDSDDSGKTRDMQTLWGKLNSKFLEAKWRILMSLVLCCREKDSPTADDVESRCRLIADDALIDLCVESLNVGGYGVLCPVMVVLKDLLPQMTDLYLIKTLVDLVWNLIIERRKTEEFRQFVKYFVEMLYQKDFIRKGDITLGILLQYTDLIFSDASIAVVNIFMNAVQDIHLADYSEALFCRVVGKGLLFGPVLRKDERLTIKVYQLINSLPSFVDAKIWNLPQCTPQDPTIYRDLPTSNDVRAMAVKMVLWVKKAPQMANKLIETLFKMEEEMTKNRTRYFGNSHVHLVKHRLMQSLLILERFLEPKQDEFEKLSKCLYRCLLTENSQPSVRYMQEWLLVRMLLRDSNSYLQFSLHNCCSEFGESNKKGLCSAIAVSYYLCTNIPVGVTEKDVEKKREDTLFDILELCFHQHFEVRLYAQVAFYHLYGYMKGGKLTETMKGYECVFTVLEDIISGEVKGNFARNLHKLSNYFAYFKPLDHYSLKTIYFDLPKLTNVDSSEWISTKTFSKYGISDLCPKDGTLRLENVNNTEKWQEESCDIVASAEDDKSEVNFANYQKKIIPKKPLMPGWDDTTPGGCDDVEKDGLIVVASLIDRIPNLGGLARTCEIFGAAEYVVSSLRYIEDKQFTSLSVTAEKWIPVKEVKLQDLFNYISEMKLKGYTVIGAEQMLHSVPLNSATFPKKSVLLLGNEKEGIPPNLLPLLDMCIEIPQLGIIRSLNVHVSGALFIWEYAKQNNLL